MKTKFHIGQRVRRTISTDSLPKGSIGTIVDQGMGRPKNRKTYGFFHIVRWDECKSGETFKTAAWNDCYSEFEKNLEPVYDGDQKIEWADCIWKPKTLEAA